MTAGIAARVAVNPGAVIAKAAESDMAATVMVAVAVATVTTARRASRAGTASPAIRNSIAKTTDDDWAECDSLPPLDPHSSGSEVAGRLSLAAVKC